MTKIEAKCEKWGFLSDTGSGQVNLFLLINCTKVELVSKLIDVLKFNVFLFPFKKKCNEFCLLVFFWRCFRCNFQT